MTPSDLTANDVALAEKMARAAALRVPAEIRTRIADDIFSDAMLGLVKASIDFEVERGIPFYAYASIRIRGEIGDGLRLIGYSIHADRRGRRLPTLISERSIARNGFRDPPPPPPLDYGNADRRDVSEHDLAVHQAFLALDLWAAVRLTVSQHRVYVRLRAGMSQNAISHELGITESGVSLAVRMIRLRVSKDKPIDLPWNTE